MKYLGLLTDVPLRLLSYFVIFLVLEILCTWLRLEYSAFHLYPGNHTLLMNMCVMLC